MEDDVEIRVGRADFKQNRTVNKKALPKRGDASGTALKALLNMPQILLLH